MHEVSLAGGILRIVEQAAERERFSRLLRLRLEAGSLAGVDVRALRFALEALSAGTLLDGARIDIDSPMGRAWCMDCAANVAIEQRGNACPACGSYQLIPNGGTELRVVDMEVADT